MATKRDEFLSVLPAADVDDPIRNGFHNAAVDWLIAQRTEGGCLAKAAPDEPLFILRAQDETAPDTVRDWVDRLVDGGLMAYNDPKAEEARAIADAMDAWQAEHGSKVPD